MISLGGSIGTSLFLSSGIALGYAGPAVLVSYAIAALIVVAMVFSLSEMAVMHPTAGSFGIYAETYLNPWAGFLVRYTYWFAQVIATGFEAVAAGIYMTYWFPGSPVWLWSLAFALVVIVTNTRSVGNFATVEYWLAFIKVTAIILFIAIGILRITGVGAEPIGFDNFHALPGGFFPHGATGVWMAVLIGLLSFIGVEMVAVTSGELPDPKTAIPAALRTMAMRLLLFYILALGIVVACIPWTQTGGSVTVAQSPFVKVLALSGIPYAAGIMNFVIISAALSGMNANLYLCSRMLFSLSRGGYAPEALGRLRPDGAPRIAVLVSGACILAASTLAMITPRAYSYLQGVALFGAITVWIIILLSHLSFRRAHRRAELPVRTPLFPVIQLIGLALLAGIVTTMALDPDWNTSVMVGVPWLCLISLSYLLWRSRRAPDADFDPAEDPSHD